ncbi:MAG: transketolase [Atopobiaceae bacterium]|nr:transketolase [Atopobiaceae bacterium]
MDYNLKEVCKDIRCDIMTCIGHLGVGHIGGCLSVVEALAVLYFKEMNIDPKQPRMAGRDRFICSKGHAGPAVYATLANRGYFDKKELLTLNQGGTNLPSHCDMNRTVGIDMTTGSLGQGFSCAVGVALGSKLEKDGATIYAMIGDGESQEGQIWEAAMSASHYKLDHIIGFVDHNGLQIDGTNDEVMTVNPIADKFAAFGWNVLSIDGHDLDAIAAAVDEAKACKGKPTVIVCETVKGKGVSFMENQVGWHGVAPNADQAAQALAELRGE